MNIDKMLEEFKIYKIDIEGKTEGSIDLYIRSIKEFCNNMKIDTYEQFIKVDAQTVKDWLSILSREHKNSATTKNNKLSAIKQIYLFLEEEKNLIIDRKISKIKCSKTVVKEQKYMDSATMEELLDAVNNLRTKSAIAVIECTGLRFKELLQLTCDDIERGYATVLGKGNKERTIYFSDYCIELCKKYIKKKRAEIVKKYNVKTNLLFISDRGGVLSKQSFSKSLKNYSNKIGLYWADEMSPHKLRHSYITKMLNENVPIQVVRDISGHTNIYTTNRYAHASQDDVRNAMLRSNNI